MDYSAESICIDNYITLVYTNGTQNKSHNFSQLVYNRELTIHKDSYLNFIRKREKNNLQEGK